MSTRNRLSGDDSKARSFANGERYPATSAMKDGTTTINMDNAVPILGEQHLNASVPSFRRTCHGYHSHFALHRHHGYDPDGEKPRRSFCRSWCEMWFLLAKSKLTCVGLSLVLFGSGISIILLTVYGGLMNCPTLNGAVVFCILLSVLSLSLGFLCCCYHWVKDDEDLPFAIFCVAYCLLLLFIFVTITGTVVVFTRIYPIGPDQPPPGISLPNKGNGTTGVDHCGMVELPLGILIICYFLSIGFVLMSYIACILALGATSDIPPL